MKTHHYIIVIIIIIANTWQSVPSKWHRGSFTVQSVLSVNCLCCIHQQSLTTVIEYSQLIHSEKVNKAISSLPYCAMFPEYFHQHTVLAGQII